MTRNPHIPLKPDTGLIRVAVMSDDPMLQGELAAVLARLDHVGLVEHKAAHVVLHDVGSASEPEDSHIRTIRHHAVPTVALVSGGAQITPALAAGARGVVLRRPVSSEIGTVISAIYSGLTVVDSELAQYLHSPPSPQTALPRDSTQAALTGRELQVAQLLSEGLSNKLIADRLSISDHTAKFHVNGVMTKLGASTRTEAVVEALRRGLIQL